MTERNFPAFPVPTQDGILSARQGMTLRYWFAGMALQGLLSDSNRGGSFREYAVDACNSADALLAELEATE